MKAGVRQFNFPTLIRFGVGVLQEIPDHLQTEGFTRPLIVVDSITASYSFFNELIRDLNMRGLHPELFNLFEMIVTESTARSGADHFRNKKCDCILAVGEATAISTGRAVALLNHHLNRSKIYCISEEGDKKITLSIPHFMVIPVASGGMELARSFEFRDEVTLERSVIYSPRLMAKVVFADPSVFQECSGQRLRECKMEIYCRLIESWYSPMHHPICEGIGLEAIRLLFETEQLHQNKLSTNEYETLLYTSLMAGISVQKGTGPLNKMAGALSAYSGCSVGSACSIMNRPVLDLSLKNRSNNLHLFGKRLCWREKTEEAILNKIIGWADHLTLPSRLSEIGIYPADLDVITRMIDADGASDSPPQIITKSEIRALLEQVV